MVSRVDVQVLITSELGPSRRTAKREVRRGMNPMIVRVPLHQDQDRTIRVEGTRITLDIVIAAFDRGLTPEEVCRQYSKLRLEDVYAALSYYHQNKSDVRENLAGREKEAEELRRKIETELGIPDLRDQLTAHLPLTSRV